MSREAPRGADRGGRPAPQGRGSLPVYHHVPVMVDAVVQLVQDVPPGRVVDATVGGGGHAVAILDARADLALTGIDRDANAIEAAASRLAGFGGRVRLVRGAFDDIGWEPGGDRSEPVVAVLFDLGVSSAQLDDRDRGFSFHADGPLDMRMDTAQLTTAADVVNGWDEHDLARILAENGEGRFARRIAAAIVDVRPIRTTGRLAEVVRGAIPAAARRHGGHPATRSFQAIRIAVNDELGRLDRGLALALHTVVTGGRVIVIAYHSGEDRIVKRAFDAAVRGGCTCPPGLPCACGAVSVFRFATTRRARQPSPTEVATNHRAASARLRAVERTPER